MGMKSKKNEVEQSTKPSTAVADRPVPTEAVIAMTDVPEFLSAIKGADVPVLRRHRANETQRERRKRLCRIDFYADAETVAVIDGLRTPRVDGAASAILNRIVAQWAKASGIIGSSMTRVRGTRFAKVVMALGNSH